MTRVVALVIAMTMLVAAANEYGSPEEILVEDAWTQVEMIAEDEEAFHGSAALTLRHIADLRAFTMAAHDEAVDFKNTNSNADAGLVKFIIEFGKVLYNKNPRTGKKTAKNFVLQYADSMDNTGKALGLGESLVGSLNKVVLSGGKKGPLETFKGKRGTMATIDYKMLGLSNRPDYLKKLAVPYSKYMDILQTMEGEAGSADAAAAAVWLRSGRSTSFTSFYNKEVTKVDGTIAESNKGVVDAARDAITKHIGALKKKKHGYTKGVTDLGALAADALKGARGAKILNIPSEDDITKRADAAAKAWVKKNKASKKVEAKKEVNKVEGNPQL